MNILQRLDRLAIKEAGRVARRNASIQNGNVEIFNFLNAWQRADWHFPDPGASGALPASRTCIVNMVSAAAETRTLAAPPRAGILLGLNFLTNGGTITLTVATPYDIFGSTTIAFTAAGQNVWLISRKFGSVYRWSLLSASGTNPIVTATAAFTASPGLHGGKTTLLSLLAGFAVTLPAATATGVKYRFVIGIVNTSGSYTIATAPTTDIFKGVVNTCSTAETPDLSQPWITSTNSNLITINGTTTGGLTIGDWIELEDIQSGVWAVKGGTTSSSTEATPFSHV